MPNSFEQLAIAYAQAKLLKAQSVENYKYDGQEEEITDFLKSYLYALEMIPNLWPDLD